MTPPVRVTLLGTRGSMPAPGPDTARYGGNTPRSSRRAGGGTRSSSTPAPASAARRRDVRLTSPSHRHHADPSAHGPYAGPRLLPSALSSGHRHSHLGPMPATPFARRADGTLPFAAAVSGPPRDLPRVTCHDVPEYRLRTRAVPVRTSLVCHPNPRSATGSRRRARRSPIFRTMSPRSASATAGWARTGRRVMSWRRASIFCSTTPSSPMMSTPAGLAGATAAIGDAFEFARHGRVRRVRAVPPRSLPR